MTQGCAVNEAKDVIQLNNVFYWVPAFAGTTDRYWNIHYRHPGERRGPVLKHSLTGCRFSCNPFMVCTLRRYSVRPDSFQMNRSRHDGKDTFAEFPKIPPLPFLTRELI